MAGYLQTLKCVHSLENRNYQWFNKEILTGYDKVPPILLGDPAYSLLPYCMKEYTSPQSNKEVIFNNMFRSSQNPVESAFGGLKARWQILNKRINMQK